MDSTMSASIEFSVDLELRHNIQFEVLKRLEKEIAMKMHLYSATSVKLSFMESVLNCSL